VDVELAMALDVPLNCETCGATSGPFVGTSRCWPCEREGKTKARGGQIKVDARVYDTLRWVAQEANLVRDDGLPVGSRLREALAALNKAYEGAS